MIPINKRVLILMTPKETTADKEDSFIIVPIIENQEIVSKGQVVAVASDAKRVAASNTVLYNRFAGHVIDHGGQPHVLINEDDILAIL